MKKINQFNIIISGVGGQGLITLLKIISQAAILENYDLKTSELHGLSQRGGSVEVHIRFGKKIFSPLIPRGKANLIIALESQEALASAYFSSPKTTFLINQYQVSTLTESASEKEIIKNLRKVSEKIILTPATEICQKELGTQVTAGIFILGQAVFGNLMPLKPNSILKAIKKVIPEKYLPSNIQAFNLGKRACTFNSLNKKRKRSK